MQREVPTQNRRVADTDTHGRTQRERYRKRDRQ
jgi:hypothetical protein